MIYLPLRYCFYFDSKMFFVNIFTRSFADMVKSVDKRGSLA